MLTPYWKSFFPNMPTYQNFVSRKKSIVFYLCSYLASQFGKCSGISFIDSTSLSVCHPKRIKSNKVFNKIAKRGKTSVGWFYGFKLHIAVNDQGELLAVMLTPGNTDDRRPVEGLVDQGTIFGTLVGDKGYISKSLFNTLLKKGVNLLTKIKKNMKNQLTSLWDKCLIRKRAIIESIIDQLKNISQIEHSRHRSPINFLVNLFAGLAAYTHQDKKPSLNLRNQKHKSLTIN